jgi:ABC-type transporter Mla subunit MlaD
MAKQSRDVSLALDKADAALLVLERLIENEEVPFKSATMREAAINKLIAEARAAVTTAQSILAGARHDMQQGLDRL